MSRDAIIDALANLVSLLIAERNAPPEEGGWIRTDNTAYRPPKSQTVPEAPKTKEHAQNARKYVKIGNRTYDADIRKEWIGRGNNHPGRNQCSICGKQGWNKRTCLSTTGPDGKHDQKHRAPITNDARYYVRKTRDL